jgi:sulfite exporter TauE/SafE
MIDFSFIAVLVASLIGSPHCAGMCGGFAIIASQDKQHPLLNSCFYHLGRLTTYISLGIVAFFIGSTIENFFTKIGVPDIAALIVGAILIVYGVGSLLGKRFLNPGNTTLSKISYLINLGRAFAKKLPLSLRSYTLGFFSTWLPCGWLYVFVLLAAKSDSILASVVGMSAFWLGTLPVLLSVGVFGKFISDRIRHAAPTISALLILSAGFFSLYSHFSHSHHDHGAHSQLNHEHHHGHAH